MMVKWSTFEAASKAGMCSSICFSMRNAVPVGFLGQFHTGWWKTHKTKVEMSEMMVATIGAAVALKTDWLTYLVFLVRLKSHGHGMCGRASDSDTLDHISGARFMKWSRLLRRATHTCSTYLKNGLFKRFKSIRFAQLLVRVRVLLCCVHLSFQSSDNEPPCTLSRWSIGVVGLGRDSSPSEFDQIHG